MVEFINRQSEIQILDNLLQADTAQFVMLFGRRRIGKTRLMTHWSRQTTLPTLYWVAKRDPKEALMTNLAQTIYAWQNDLDYTDIEIRPSSWEAVFRMLAQAIGDQKVIVILDELPYALQQDAGLGSHLQAAWDHLFKDSKALLFLSGSHIGMLTDLTTYQAPLYGRLTHQFPLYPFAFKEITPFLPNYDTEKRLAVYAILGGVPAYLERWDDTQSISQNVTSLFLQRTGWFRNEPFVLISDLTQRETTSYEAIVQAIADGRHRRDNIAAYAAIPSTSLSHYLARLIELQFVERRVPATVPLAQIKTSRQSRYHLRDPFLRFYYRFINPNLHLIERGLSHRLWQMMSDNLRAFVAYTFEELCRNWVLQQAQQGTQLPFPPDNIGSHWSKTVQVDVVAIAWREKQLLLGECKWGDSAVSRQVITELIEKKTPKLLQSLPDKGAGWEVHYAFFGRHSFTTAAKEAGTAVGAMFITLVDIINH